MTPFIHHDCAARIDELKARMICPRSIMLNKRKSEVSSSIVRAALASIPEAKP